MVFFSLSFLPFDNCLRLRSTSQVPIINLVRKSNRHLNFWRFYFSTPSHLFWVLTLDAFVWVGRRLWGGPGYVGPTGFCFRLSDNLHQEGRDRGSTPAVPQPPGRRQGGGGGGERTFTVEGSEVPPGTGPRSTSFLKRHFEWRRTDPPLVPVVGDPCFCENKRGQTRKPGTTFSTVTKGKGLRGHRWREVKEWRRPTTPLSIDPTP